MAGMSFDHGGRRCIRPILEQYQSGRGKSPVYTYQSVMKTFSTQFLPILRPFFYPAKGESEGYTVKCKEKDFPISNYPLEQTEFYYAQKQARDKLADEKNREFDYTMFHHRNGMI